MIGADAFPLDKFPQLATINEPKSIVICVLLALAGFAASFLLAKLDEAPTRVAFLGFFR